MNILLANYGDFATNSMNHIAPFANHFARQGHACIVAVPSNRGSIAVVSCPLFQPATFGDVLHSPTHFANGRGADVLHLWTPREANRRFAEQYQFRYTCPVVLHLEDNEEQLMADYYGQTIESLREQEVPEGFEGWESALAHPLHSLAAQALADATSAVIEPLFSRASYDRPQLRLWPGVPSEFFDLPPSGTGLRRDLGLHEDDHVIVYPGGITASNREDVRSLVLAAKRLLDEGRRIRIVKTGPSAPDFWPTFAFETSSWVRDLGIQPRRRLPEILGLADLLVQPGTDDAFNRFRLPSKLPEFLASKRPVITACSNLGRHLVEGEHCLLHDGSPESIARQCSRALDDSDLARAIARGGYEFARKAFDTQRNANALLEFYEAVVEGGSRNWRALFKTAPDYSLALPNRLAELRSPELSVARLARALALRSRAARLEETEPASVGIARAAASECAQKAAERLSQQIDALQKSAAEASQLRAKNAELERQLDQARAALQRTRQSFSWRATAPLRAARRLLWDPVFKPPTAPNRLSPAHLKPDATATEQLAEPPPAEEQSKPPEPPAYRDYEDFCGRMKPLVERYCRNFSARLSDMEDAPLISVVMPVYNTDARWLDEAIESVRGQIYSHWELCIADDASTAPYVRDLLDRHRAADSRIKVFFRKENGHISAASNSALAMATGEYVALLDHDDRIPKHALARVADAILQARKQRRPEPVLIYSDEDKIDESGNRFAPHFKSDWNPDLLLGQNFISHLGVYKMDALRQAQGFREGYEGAQDWDLALRISQKCGPEQIIHIPEVLYHWRMIAGSTASDIAEKSYAHQAAKRAIQDHCLRLGRMTQLLPVDRFYWRARYILPPAKPSVSIIIPTRDRIDLLKPCIDSIESKTAYKNYRIIIADNDSLELASRTYFEQVKARGHRVIQCPGEFNYAAINNRAIADCDTDLICLLNNDVTVITPDWLEELASQASRMEIACVGPKLFYPHEHVQHAGIVLGIGGVASEAFKKIHRDDDGYIHRACLAGNYSAVTGACMAFRKSVWQELGGLNESDVPNAFGDVDFCLRAIRAGYRNLFTPFAELYHHESASRGDDLAPERRAAFEKAIAYMKANWGHVIERDPYYNPNLTLQREDFCLSFPPRGYSTA